ncbi:NAD+ synthase [Rubellimicrobium sp. CFH 75288]|uniref:NAD+ synthase n=1 Tax=Rubellimicrobium sp. CFH 75288 TaxID=2697034 RepID=UPI0014127864|nr:NAD+ synthase [Rubellimicrobium sp. CFH 75288]
MTDRFRLTLGQLNATLGDIEGNLAKARAAWEAGREAGADLVALPEMFATGYQLQDLVMKPAFHRDAMRRIEDFARTLADGPPLTIGGPWAEGGALFNAYWLLRDGRVAGRVLKHELPNYTVFDERRHYTPGPPGEPFDLGPLRVGTPICEDAWYPTVAARMDAAGAGLLLVANGSPYDRGKWTVRLNRMRARVTETELPLVYLNLVGGQDDQVFDGGSFVLNRDGGVALRLPHFEEAVEHVDFRRTPNGWVAAEGPCAPRPDAAEMDYHAMVLALRDYLAKSGIERVLLGLSGGVDSALVAAVATDAVGPDRVRGVRLPSRYSSEGSLRDAEAVARALGCRLDTIPIEGPHAAVSEALAPFFAGTEPGVAEENVQSRLRGLLLMALSNKTGEMLLTTGNKSEMAVGYATIYGDMAGGYNPLKDLYKTRVFAACRWRNAHHRPWMKGPPGEVIPPRVIDKPPSAELRPDQRDEDTLPPYPVLDSILEILVEGDGSVEDCLAVGHDRATVKKVEALLYGAEWKRFQSAPGARLTRRAFWLDRRYPIVNRWRDPG